MPDAKETVPDYVESCISTHTFLWSFTFDVDKRRRLLRIYGQEDGVWKPDPPMESKEGKDFLDAYMVAQYFNRQAREIFCGENNPAAPCCRFRYDPKRIVSFCYYIESGDFKYSLPVTDIRLFLFHSCGILVFDTCNMEYGALEDIKRINDWGRRVRIPFMPRPTKEGLNETGFTLCADRLGIVCRDGHGQKDLFVEDFRARIGQTVRGALDEEERRALLGPARFIYDILSNGGTRVTDELIDAASDDRMFLVAMVKNVELAKLYKGVQAVLDDGAPWPPKEKDGTSVKTSMTRDEMREHLYSLVFADQKDPTCQDKEMQQRLLEKALYRRWSGKDSLYAVTTLSFMCLTNKADIVDSVYRPFVTEYLDMAILVLAQRASMERFDTEAGRVVNGADTPGYLNSRQIQDIIDLHEQYVTWQNQVNLVELTDQEQGIDVYALLREQMGVEARTDRLDKQLEDMYAVANVNQNTKLSELAGIFAVVAILVDILVNLATLPNGDSMWIPLPPDPEGGQPSLGPMQPVESPASFFSGGYIGRLLQFLGRVGTGTWELPQHGFEFYQVALVICGVGFIFGEMRTSIMRGRLRDVKRSLFR